MADIQDPGDPGELFMHDSLLCEHPDAKVEDLSPRGPVTIQLGTILGPDETSLRDPDEIVRRMRAVQDLGLGYAHARWFTDRWRSPNSPHHHPSILREFQGREIYFPGTFAKIGRFSCIHAAMSSGIHWVFWWTVLEGMEFLEGDRIAVAC